MAEQNWQPPDWWYAKEKRPTKNDAYFENMSHIIFQTGLNWAVIEKKWPTIKQAFADFSIDKVSRYTDVDIIRLMKDKGIIRNTGKIKAIIQNAIQFQQITKEFGSFQKYLDSLDKSKNYVKVIKELSSRFKWLGPSSTSIFLYTVGEDIKQEG